MKIILTEEQYNTLLVENVIKDIFKDLNINAGVLFTFGTGMGAILPIVDRLLKGDGISIDKTEVAFLIITAVAILIKDSNSEKLLDKVEENGQLDILDSVILFLDKLFSLLRSLIKKFLNVSYSIAEIIGFSFLLNPAMKVMNEFISEYKVSMSNVTTLFTGIGLASIIFGLKSVLKKMTNKLNEDVVPSKTAVKNICDSEKFCDAQGKITFGQLKAIVDSATNKRLYKHIGEGGFKATLRLLPWFLPQLAVAGFITSTVRAINKILKPALTETETYKTWWGKAVLKAFDLTEGELHLNDPLYEIFFISDGLMTMLDDKYKVKFARHIADLASSMSDDQEVPEFFVENELRNWINEKFLLNPPLPPKEKPSEDERFSNSEEI
jgi:hypothetical protein